MRRSLIVVGILGAGLALGACVAVLVQRARRARARSVSLSSRRPRDGASLPHTASSTGPAGSSARLDTRDRADGGAAARSPLVSDPRLSGLALAAIAGTTLVGGLAFVVVGAPWLLARQHFPAPPEQPIFFSHEVHVQKAGLDCAFCHRTADRVATAGFPDAQQCMFCHVVVDDIQQAAFEGQVARLRSVWVEGASMSGRYLPAATASPRHTCSPASPRRSGRPGLRSIRCPRRRRGRRPPTRLPGARRAELLDHGRQRR